MSNTLQRKLTWRLEILMAECKIRSATELHRKLVNYGYEITSSQLSRIVKDRPERVSTELLDLLLDILKCEIGDLLRSEPVSGEDAIIKQKQRVRREPVTDNSGADLTGPKLTALPVPPVED
jgi:DNA-binding Xre family transcriptional regulator